MKNGNEYFVRNEEGRNDCDAGDRIGSIGMTGLAAQGSAILVQPEKQVTSAKQVLLQQPKR